MVISDSLPSFISDFDRKEFLQAPYNKLEINEAESLLFSNGFDGILDFGFSDIDKPVLRGEILQFFLTHKPFKKYFRFSKLIIKGTQIVPSKSKIKAEFATSHYNNLFLKNNYSLNLEGSKIEFDLSFENCEFSNGVFMERAICENIDFKYCRINYTINIYAERHAINADSIRCKNFLLLNCDLMGGGINLINASINFLMIQESKVNLPYEDDKSNAEISIEAPGATFNSIFIRGSLIIGDIYLHVIEVKNDIEVTNSKILAINQHRTPVINFSNSKIGCRLTFDRTFVMGEVDLYSILISKSLDIRNGIFYNPTGFCIKAINSDIRVMMFSSRFSPQEVEIKSLLLDELWELMTLVYNIDKSLEIIYDLIYLMEYPIINSLFQEKHINRACLFYGMVSFRQSSLYNCNLEGALFYGKKISDEERKKYLVSFIIGFLEDFSLLKFEKLKNGKNFKNEKAIQGILKTITEYDPDESNKNFNRIELQVLQAEIEEFYNLLAPIKSWIKNNADMGEKTSMVENTPINTIITEFFLKKYKKDWDYSESKIEQIKKDKKEGAYVKEGSGINNIRKEVWDNAKEGKDLFGGIKSHFDEPGTFGEVLLNENLLQIIDIIREKLPSGYPEQKVDDDHPSLDLELSRLKQGLFIKDNDEYKILIRGTLNLKNAWTDLFVFDPQLGSHSFTNWNIDGFEYNDIDVGEGKDDLVSCKWFKTEDTNQPYNQLSNVLYTSGDDLNSRKVLLKQRYKYWYENALLWLLGKILKAGAPASNALIALSVLTIIGAIFFHIFYLEGWMVKTQFPVNKIEIKPVPGNAGFIMNNHTKEVDSLSSNNQSILFYDIIPYVVFNPFFYSMESLLPIGIGEQTSHYSPRHNGKNWSWLGPFYQGFHRIFGSVYIFLFFLGLSRIFKRR